MPGELPINNIRLGRQGALHYPTLVILQSSWALGKISTKGLGDFMHCRIQHATLGYSDTAVR